MSLLRLILLSMANRSGALLLTVISMVISVALVLGVERLHEGVRSGFSTTVSGVDLIIGPRGAPLQLVLSALFRIGSADHAVDWSLYQELENDPQIVWVIPLAFGDSFKGFPVVATNGNYFDHLKYGRSRPLVFEQGRRFGKGAEVVLGALVARQLQLPLGAEIELSHGLGEAARHRHEEHHFEVVGILAPTGTPVDRSVHISLDAMAELHAGWIGGMPIPGVRVRPAHDHPEQLNAILVGLTRRTAVFDFKRRIEERTDFPLSAVLPALALDQLWQLVEPVQRAIQGLAMLVFVAAALGVAASMLNALQARRREMAILRAVGAGPHHLLLLSLAESAIVTLMGIIGGVLSGLLLLQLGEGWLLEHLGVALSGVRGPSLDLEALKWLKWLFVTGLAAGLIPALRAYRLSLADGLVVKE